MKKNNKIRYITYTAVIAACYVVLTYLTNLLGLASGVIQCRFSEAMCVLPAFTSAAIPGLAIGCFLANLLTGAAIPDIIFGSLATLIGAAGTYMLSKKGAAKLTYSLPPIVANTIIVPFVLKFAYGLEEGIGYFFITVGLGEIISCGVFGLILYEALKKRAEIIFEG